MDWNLRLKVDNYLIGRFWLFYLFNGSIWQGILMSSVNQFLVHASKHTDVHFTNQEVPNKMTTGKAVTTGHSELNRNNFYVHKFDVIWNVPTVECHKHGFNFSQVREGGILQNAGDQFRGDKMVILYDPGLFPAILSTGDRNGGLPQEGDINLHLRKFAADLEHAVPKDFDGVGVIDFERWRPIFRQNWFRLDIYLRRSLELEKKKNPKASQSTIDKQKVKNFEKAAFYFFDHTLSLARKLRPNARWGYYGFPYCFNYNNITCSAYTKSDNDRSYWMWKTGNALFPSTYIHERTLSEAKRAKMIEGRTDEGVRVAGHKSPRLPVYIYISYRYMDTGNFLSRNDMKISLDVPRRAGASGVVIWGPFNDTNSYTKCAKLNSYVNGVLLPLMQRPGGLRSFVP